MAETPAAPAARPVPMVKTPHRETSSRLERRPSTYRELQRLTEARRAEVLSGAGGCTRAR